jgi:phenylacetate-CoA ligase
MHQVSDFYAQATLMPVRPRRNFVDIDEPIERIAERTVGERPDLLVGYGGWINLFFRTVQARGLEIAKPKLVMSMGEALPHGGRELIEDGFGIPVMQRYNAVEALKIGFYCEERTGFHIHEDLTHVRVDDGGGIVLSNLVNRGTVLLNYPIGDVGTIATEPCPCGRTLNRLETLEGRVEDIVALPDGRFVHPRQVWEVMKAEPRVLQYQLLQSAPDRFTLEVALAESGDAAPQGDTALGEAAASALTELLGGATVEVRRRPEEPRRGKFRAVVALR